jgi:hypothetical protein
MTFNLDRKSVSFQTDARRSLLECSWMNNGDSNISAESKLKTCYFQQTLSKNVSIHSTRFSSKSTSFCLPVD